MRVSATGIDVAIAGRTIVADAVLDAPSGAFVGLLGPNGSGKTTLLRTVYRALRPARGAVLLGHTDVWSLTARQAARRTAVVMQDDPTEFEFTVREVVGLGRVPHQNLLGRATGEDQRAVDAALARTGVEHLAERPVSSLSGGERQRVFLARALAQDTPILVLDEPTNHLDVTAQLELLELVRGLGVTVVAALHDLNLAAAYCDQICVLRAGRLVASGPVADVLTADLIAEVYGVRAALVTNPLTGQRGFAFAPSPESVTQMKEHV
ncbi:ABC transporter ATP-binding protein [Cryptosporangium arvum]|uniref:ABC-type cobalamin/Fe3+-siderophore transport system, ATPase component n=1 Tax=Cryptosporangium arvum DSM 44712 TaxID=927661 RepID=A0A010ZP82_9ACTN|nr:ABC transporter ATP-binding protein [Cryptosporangium arvum]EXG80494.1 ABC-type cobalamin/Fe3+-siderophore transport system, ATPase component [Cryptosporangium arvum DSM 44712]